MSKQSACQLNRQSDHELRVLPRHPASSSGGGGRDRRGVGGADRLRLWGAPVPIFWGSLVVVVPKAGAYVKRREQLLRKGEPCVCMCVCRRESVCPFAQAPATSHAPRRKLPQILRSFFFNLMCFGFVFTVHNLLCRPSQPLFPQFATCLLLWCT